MTSGTTTPPSLAPTPLVVVVLLRLAMRRPLTAFFAVVLFAAPRLAVVFFALLTVPSG
jgi:hypothetical protein